MLEFVGIGAQKSATTWLYETLKRHPKIAFPAGKEVHFWDNYGKNSNIEWYLSLFPNDGNFNGEITPAYTFLPIGIIEELFKVAPNVRLIMLIRNPMERAWSSAKMALARAEMTDAEASDQWFIDHFNSYGSLARGNYEASIRNWRHVFPADQLIIVQYEEVCRDPVSAANTILNHLGFDLFFQQADRVELERKVFEGDRTPIRASLIPVLKEIYSDKIDSLSEYLGLDLSAWKNLC